MNFSLCTCSLNSSNNQQFYQNKENFNQNFSNIKQNYNYSYHNEFYMKKFDFAYVQPMRYKSLFNLPNSYQNALSNDFKNHFYGANNQNKEFRFFDRVYLRNNNRSSQSIYSHYVSYDKNTMSFFK